MTATQTNGQGDISIGSLGLSTALAVAYDIFEESSYSTNSLYSPTTPSELSGVFETSTLSNLQNQPSCYCSSSIFNPALSTCNFMHCSPWQSTINGHLVPSSQISAYLTPIPTISENSIYVASRDVAYLSSPSYHLSSLPSESIDVRTPSQSMTSSDPCLSVPSSAYYSPQTLSHLPPDPSPAAAISLPPPPPTSADDALYQLSEEKVFEIDEMLTHNPHVTSSRHWKYYTETNEWTRATCALMACLFTRDQMANSTVLGRGSSQREKLPTTLVSYVVTKMRCRFNKSAAAVRARMAQKCKDERRFGRVLPPCLTVGAKKQAARLPRARNGEAPRRLHKSATVALVPPPSAANTQPRSDPRSAAKMST